MGAHFYRQLSKFLLATLALLPSVAFAQSDNWKNYTVSESGAGVQIPRRSSLKTRGRPMMELGGASQLQTDERT